MCLVCVVHFYNLYSMYSQENCKKSRVFEVIVKYYIFVKIVKSHLFAVIETIVTYVIPNIVK